MAKGGRPRIEIDWQIFDNLCALQCTLTEIAATFNCSEDTIERAVKREKKMGFAEYFDKRRSKGKISLRRAQFKLAEKNATMAIFLGKQYLGQKDVIEQTPDIVDPSVALERFTIDELEKLREIVGETRPTTD